MIISIFYYLKCRSNIILKIILPIHPAFTNHWGSFNAACSELQNLEVCLKDVMPVFHSYYYIWCYVVVENNLDIHSQVCAASFRLSWEGSWSSQHIWAVILVFLKQSSDNSFSWAVVTFEVAPHQKTMCPHGMKVVIYSSFTAYYWVGSQWRLSKQRVRRWTWCSYKYLGEHMINRLDRTNKICCTRNGRRLLFKTITSINDGQHTALYSGL